MITIGTNPAAFSTVFQPIFFQLTSNKANAELKIKCEVQQYKTGAWTAIARQTIDKVPGQSYFRFYCQTILNAAILCTIPTGLHGAIITDSGSIINYRVKFTEMIFDAEGLYVESQNITSSAFNASNMVFQAGESGNAGDFTLESFKTLNKSFDVEAKPGQPIIISYIYNEAVSGNVTTDILIDD